MTRLRPSGFGAPSGDLALLRLLQVFDSQFPVGAFAHSGGIETYAALGGGLPELREVLRGQIELGWGRSELGAAHLAWRATDQHGPTQATDQHGPTQTTDQHGPRQARDQHGPKQATDQHGSTQATDQHGPTQPRTATDQHGPTQRYTGDAAALESLSRQLDALKVVPAVRNASVRLGRRTLDLLRRLYPEACVDIRPSHHAIVVGAAGRRLGLDARSLLVAYGQNLAMSTLTSAIRCMSVSPAQAQELLMESHGPLARAVEGALENPEGALFTCTPALDIRSHQQAFLHTRLFQS